LCKPASQPASITTKKVTIVLFDPETLELLARSGEPLPCWTQDPELFFAESPTDLERAKSLCVGCPARLSCLTGALQRQEVYGVWGGELLMQGVVVPRKRPRGRPRKDDAYRTTEAIASARQATAA
jgi:WhiB family redox-sensing transcriptional regulator